MTSQRRNKRVLRAEPEPQQGSPASASTLITHAINQSRSRYCWAWHLPNLLVATTSATARFHASQPRFCVHACQETARPVKYFRHARSTAKSSQTLPPQMFLLWQRSELFIAT